MPRPRERERATYPSDGDIVSIFGAPGAGKSTLAARAISRDILEHGRRVVAHDPTGSLARYSIERYGVPREWVVRIGTAKSARAYYRFNVWQRWRRGATGARLISMGKVNRTQSSRDVGREFLDAASDSLEGWVYATDEAEMIYGTEKLDEENEDKLRDIVKLARNNRVRLYAAGQRPQHTRVLLRANSSIVCVMKSDSENFQETGMREFGDVELFEPAGELEPFEYLYRPKWRRKTSDPLALYHALEDPIPWE